MQISIGKLGSSIDVDESKFNDAVKAYVFNYGLTQILNDCHSTVTEKAEPDAGKRAAQVNALIAKKLDAMFAGDIRVASARTGDPVKAEAVRIATKAVVKHIKAKGGSKGKDPKKYTGAEIRAAVDKAMAANPAIMETAKANVEKARALEVETTI